MQPQRTGARIVGSLTSGGHDSRYYGRPWPGPHARS
jgi:hypothetical protein